MTISRAGMLALLPQRHAAIDPSREELARDHHLEMHKRGG